MARLPKVQDNAVLLQQPRSRLSAADIANPYMQIANAFGTLGTWAQEREIQQASVQGANGVYRDPDGNLKVDLRSNWSKSGEAYNRAAMQAYTARLSGDIRTNGAKLATDAGGNIDAFNSSWKGFADGLLKGVPEEARGAITTMLETEGQRLGLGVSEQKRTRDIKVFEGNIKSEIDLLDNEMATLARNGGTNTPDYLEKQGQMRSLWGELAANPEFTVGDKEADIAIQRMQSRHQSEAIVGTVEKALVTSGVGEARKLKERILSDESLKLTPAERRQYAGLAEARIDGWVAEQKVALEPWKEKKKKLTALLDEGVGIDSPDIDETALALARGGDTAGAMELYAKRATARALADFSGMSNPDQAAALQRGLDAAKGVNVALPSGTTVADGIPPEGAALLNTIAGTESPGYDVLNGGERISDFSDHPRRVGRGGTTTAAGRYQFVKGTWDRAARAVGAGDFSPKNQDKAAWWLAQADYKAHTGRDLLTDLRSPDRNVQAGIRRALANTWEGLKSLGDGAFANKVASGGSLPEVDPKVIKDMRAEVTSDAKNAWEDMQAGLKKGIPPAPEEVDLFSRQLAMVDDEDFKSEVSRFLEAEVAGGKIADLPGDQAAAIIAALQSDAADGATIAQQEILAAAERGYAQKQEALKADPIGWAVDHRVSDPVPAIDVSAGPEGLATAFAGRQRAVDLLRARGEVGNVSALRPEDEKTIGRIFQTATPAEQAQFIGTMRSALKPDTYMATIEKMSGKDGMKGMAAAGALYAENPEVAEGILRGQALLRENPKFAPADTVDNRAGIDEILPASVFASGLEGGRQQLLEAATARYADLSSVAGDTTADLNVERMEQAVNEVTGGMLDMNGQSVIAPRYGMSQDEFDTMLDGLTDADLVGAITSDGTPITARDLRTYGRLKAVGAGQYMLEFGPDWASGSFAMAQPDFGDRSERVRRGVFVLELGDR